MIRSKLMIVFSILFAGSCKNPKMTSNDKAIDARKSGDTDKITSIQVYFPFSKQASYGNDIAVGTSLAYAYVEDGSATQSNESTLGTVEELLGTDTDRIRGIAHIEKIMASDEGWLARKTITVCYDLNSSDDPTKALARDACREQQRYDAVPIIGARIFGRSESGQWNCGIGYEINNGRKCIDNNDRLKSEIQAKGNISIKKTFRKVKH